jgi:glycosyltransferase involved in cell wall biosynthesis
MVSFVFVLIPSKFGDASLFYLKELAEAYPKNVMVFRGMEGTPYRENLLPCGSYLLFSSLYEPFGSPSEGYSNGVPVIARATGGLIQQIFPYNINELPYNVQNLIKENIKDEYRKPTGFLFKEKLLNDKDAIESWNDFMGYSQDVSLEYLEILYKQRLVNPLTLSMVKECMRTFKIATDIYLSEDFVEYTEMMKNGFKLLEDEAFSWEKTALNYDSELYSKSR